MFLKKAMLLQPPPATVQNSRLSQETQNPNPKIRVRWFVASYPQTRPHVDFRRFQPRPSNISFRSGDQQTVRVRM